MIIKTKLNYKPYYFEGKKIVLMYENVKPNNRRQKKKIKKKNKTKN